MSFATVLTRTLSGIDAPQVTVETHISNGLPKFSMVGLPETAVKESKDRVRSAILQSQLQFPTRRLTVNLAPAHLPKFGSRFDLPIALGILTASKQLPPENLLPYEFIGELGLNGELRPVLGILPAVLAAQKDNRTLILPAAQANEAALSGTTHFLTAHTLLDVLAHLTQTTHLPNPECITHPKAPPCPWDFSRVKGQTKAKRALEIAAAGKHAVLMIGPPGVGKTLLANSFTSLLPPLSQKEALDVTVLYSLIGQSRPLDHWHTPPFCSPHHTSSHIALVGGGMPIRPGEISLSHHGILFLDELPEYDRKVLESLREPMESGVITIARARQRETYPAQFQLIAAMNPCPCGYFGSQEKECHCTLPNIKRYQQKISGPLLDRVGLCMGLLESTHTTPETSQTIAKRVQVARHIQIERQGKLNDALTHTDFESHPFFEKGASSLLQKYLDIKKPSMRTLLHIKQIARTCADLQGNEYIQEDDLAEVLDLKSSGESFFVSRFL